MLTRTSLRSIAPAHRPSLRAAFDSLTRPYSYHTMTTTAAAKSKRPLSGVFAIDKPSGPTSMSLLDELKPLFASSALFLNADGSLPDNRKPTGKRDRRGRGGGGGKWDRSAGRKGEPLPPKIGQGGTLDPLASGVLVIGVGDGTKKLQTYLDGTKDYLTIGLLGSSTTSYDSQDPILYREPHAHVTAQTLAEHLPSFRGSILQAPPLYSALRIDGMRLFEYARQGKELPRPIERRKVEVKTLQLNQWLEAGSHPYKEPSKEVPAEEKALVGKVRRLAGDATAEEPATVDEVKEAVETASAPIPETKPTAKSDVDQAHPEKSPAAFGLTMSVGGGTYVRSIVHDLARQAGSAAHVVALRRTKQGQWQTDRWYRPRRLDELGASDAENWAAKEELLEPPASSGTDASAVELVKGNCIPWSVFQQAIDAMKAGDKPPSDGDKDDGPAEKKRKADDGSAVAASTEPVEPPQEDGGDGLQEWERVLLAHIDAC